MKPRLVKLESDLGPWFQTLLLMEEIRNNHLGCMKPCKYVMGYLPYQLVSRISGKSTVLWKFLLSSCGDPEFLEVLA